MDTPNYKHDTAAQAKAGKREDPTPAKDAESTIFKKKFGARDYMLTYYPERIDIDKFVWAMKAVREALSENNGSVNIKDIVEKTNLPHETVENVVIFDFQKTVARNLLEAFPQDNIKVLDVGGGPTIYQHILVSLEAGSITHSEFLEQNRAEVKRWLDQEDNCYNWDDYFLLMRRTLKEDEKYMSILKKQTESDDEQTKRHAQNVLKLLESDDVEEMKKHLRVVINSVIHGDVFKKGLDLPAEDHYDAVTSSGREASNELLTSNFTIESATSNRTAWEQGMKNIIEAIKPGGYLSLSAIRNAEWYLAGKEKMPATKINEKDIVAFLEQNRFRIVETAVLEGSDKEKVGYDGMVFVFAQKASLTNELPTDKIRLSNQPRQNGQRLKIKT